MLSPKEDGLSLDPTDKTLFATPPVMRTFSAEYARPENNSLHLKLLSKKKIDMTLRKRPQNPCFNTVLFRLLYSVFR